MGRGRADKQYYLQRVIIKRRSLKRKFWKIENGKGNRQIKWQERKRGNYRVHERMMNGECRLKMKSGKRE